MSRQITTLTLADARKIIAAGEKKARELGVPYNIAVVDAGGGLISHARMDGAWLGSVDISIRKAWTSRAFDMSTDDISGVSQSGGSLFGINTTNEGHVVIWRCTRESGRHGNRCRRCERWQRRKRHNNRASRCRRVHRKHLGGCALSGECE
jgi:uncharacterized protein GlcG (DUF336 family)